MPDLIIIRLYPKKSATAAASSKVGVLKAVIDRVVLPVFDFSKSIDP